MRKDVGMGTLRQANREKIESRRGMERWRSEPSARSKIDGYWNSGKTSRFQLVPFSPVATPRLLDLILALTAFHGFAPRSKSGRSFHERATSVSRFFAARINLLTEKRVTVSSTIFRGRGGKAECKKPRGLSLLAARVIRQWPCGRSRYISRWDSWLPSVTLFQRIFSTVPGIEFVNISKRSTLNWVFTLLLFILSLISFSILIYCWSMQLHEANPNHKQNT